MSVLKNVLKSVKKITHFSCIFAAKAQSGRKMSKVTRSQSAPCNLIAAEELCLLDDVALSLVLDPMLKMKTHKMDIQTLPINSNVEELRAVVEEFVVSQEYQGAYEKFLMTEGALWAALKTSVRMENLKEHVSDEIFFYLESTIMNIFSFATDFPIFESFRQQLRI